ncbi:hypothetical protein IAG25_32715 [Caballeronia sp. EK]|uniref:hypothetical protein n=1 Tax=Caballeronia sp. EK TaxID=2767469 RepID=UPI001655E48D|nr:hypothetical protein [Caballeronia sp. EK]MBC8641588.1 hypothetical protein [Caballeronia sp. EK]
MMVKGKKEAVRGNVVATVLLASIIGTTISAATALSSLSGSSDAILAASLTAALPIDPAEKGAQSQGAKGRDGEPVLTKELRQRREQVDALTERAKKARSVFRDSLFALAVSLCLAFFASLEVAIVHFKRPKADRALAV